MNSAAEKWTNKFHTPTVIGAVDCMPTEIHKPKYFRDSYINLKGFASINVQMTCDTSEKITMVDATSPGSMHNSCIWRRSTKSGAISIMNGNFCLLSDNGYGITPWHSIQTPYKQGRRKLQLYSCES